MLIQLPKWTLRSLIAVTPAAFSLFLTGELAKYQRLVKSLNIKAE